MGNKNGHIRTISRMERLLSEYGKLDTIQILEGLMVQKSKSGKVYQSCPTMQQLAGLLSGNKQFRACDHSVVKSPPIASYTSASGGVYNVIVWELVEPVKRENNGKDTTVS